MGAAKYLKFADKRLLLALNLNVLRISAVEVSFFFAAAPDPLTYQYLSDLRIAPTRAVELSQVRAGIMGFTYGAESPHPLIAAFRAAISAADPEAEVRALLSGYYAAVQPRDAAEVVGLPPAEAPGLMTETLGSWVMPWSERSAADTARHRRICLEEEGLANGIRLTLEDGATFFGPVSPRKLDLEVARITSLARSMKMNGFRPDAARPVEVIALRSGGEYRWLVVQGQHRIAACAAFGIESLDVRILRIIRREDAAYWPHVVAGTFTIDGALACFDRLFAGQPGPSAAGWCAERPFRLREHTSAGAAPAPGARRLAEAGVPAAARSSCTTAGARERQRHEPPEQLY